MVVAVVLVVVGGGRDGRNVLADIGCRVKIGTLIVRIGFWAVLYYSYNKQPQYTIGNYSGLYITSVTLLRFSYREGGFDQVGSCCGERCV